MFVPPDALRPRLAGSSAKIVPSTRPLEVPLKRFLCLVLAAIGIGSAAADILPRMKEVPAELCFEGTEGFPGMEFALFSVRRSEELAAEVKPGVFIEAESAAAPRLYALKPGSDISKISVFESGSVLAASYFVRTAGSVGIQDPAERVRLTYQITGIEGHNISFKFLHRQRFDRAGNPLDPPPASSPADQSEDKSVNPAADRTADRSEKKPWASLMAGLIGLSILLAFVVIRAGRVRRAATSAKRI